MKLSRRFDIIYTHHLNSYNKANFYCFLTSALCKNEDQSLQHTDLSVVECSAHCFFFKRKTDF